MRIAFVSCVFTALYPQQPVWDWIAARQLAAQQRVLMLSGDVGPQQIDISLFNRNRLELSRTIFRQTWLP